MSKLNPRPSIHEAMAWCRALSMDTIMVCFTDATGQVKGKLIPLDQLPQAVDHGVGFAGPSLMASGLPRMGPRSEYYVRADLNTLAPVPWMSGVGAVLGSGYLDAQAADMCPRQMLQTQVARLAARGWVLATGIEPEFFLLDAQAAAAGQARPYDAHDVLDKPSYDWRSLQSAQPILHDLRLALEGAGMHVLQTDHEDAQGQFELNFGFADALRSADNIAFFKLAAQSIARAHGAWFSTMPKPFADQPGSGLHFHISLWDRTPNGARGPIALFDPPSEHDKTCPLSDLGQAFMAGVMHHSAALCALAAPTINSYKRLTVGPSRSGTSWAPATVTHGPNNRTALLCSLPGRFEWRLPDASANVYLCSAALIAAGLDGVDRGLPLPPAQEGDLFAQPAQAQRLPQSLGEALDALEHDPVIAEALGAAFVQPWLAHSRDQIHQHRSAISAWELAQYL